MNFSNHNFQTDEDILKDIELGNEKMKSKPKEKSKVSNYIDPRASAGEGKGGPCPPGNKSAGAHA